MFSPFTGLLFDLDRVGDVGAATSPPYDVISPEERLELVAASPYNVVNVLLAGPDDPDYASALEDTSWDELLEEETELAQRRAGRDIGTPMITFNRPDGRALSFFGPVISRVPSTAEAVPLWEAVTTLAEFPGFAEMKRSMREVPQLRVIGGLTDEPEQEDWTGGHRRGHLASDRKAPSPE